MNQLRALTDGARSLGQGTARLLRRFAAGVRTATELLGHLWRGPYWWLVPIVLMLLPLALIFIALQIMPLVSPFVYTVF